MRMADVWRWQGSVTRGQYALLGVAAFLVKFGVDNIVAHFLFHRSWGLFSYWQPITYAARLSSLPAPEASFAGTMVAVAIPFIWFGVGLTVCRLRNVGIPIWRAILFFIPYVNLAFFAALCALPKKEEWIPGEMAAARGKSMREDSAPEGSLGSAALAIVDSLLFGLAMAFLSTTVLRTYGFGLFVGLPFGMGLIASLVYGWQAPRGLSSRIGVAILAVSIAAALLLAMGVEGAICLVMAAPISLVLAAMGAWFGYMIQGSPRARHRAPAAMVIVLLSVPSLQTGEAILHRAPPVYRVSSSVEVNATPEKVWNQVVAFAEIPPPTELLFRAGIAYPIRAEISGHGVGAVRHCVFSTGPFAEPIEVWDEPRLLKFGVTANPAPLNELSPYGNIQPPHLHGYFVSKQGQFLLTALPGGRTRLEGATWYQHTMWPATYWHLWSDYIIHKIHLRVLEHIREEVEEKPRA